METMIEALDKLHRKVKKEIAKKKYNDRMKKRLHKVNGPGNTHKVHYKEPQSRKVSTKVNKGEEFTRLSRYERRILKRGY